MSIQVVFKNLDRSDSLVQFIEKQSAKIMKFVKPSARITYYIEKLSNGLKVSLQLDEYGKHFEAQAINSNAYAGIDGALKRMNRQLREGHSLVTDKIHR
ncbi:MAG: HPF/RaiA family ribosome-associated protein [Bacteriovoracaceae bacterium]